MQLRVARDSSTGFLVAQCHAHRRAQCPACSVDVTAINTLAQHLHTYPLGKPIPISQELAHLKDTGNQRFRSGHYAESIEAYSRALQLHLLRPSYTPFLAQEVSVLYSNRSAAEVELGWFEEAVIDARECVKMRGDWPKGWFRLGRGLEGVGDYKEAMEAYEKAGELGAGNEARDGWQRCMEKMRKQR